MSLSPTTKLEAVNTMLTSIGEQPIQNMNDLAGLSDASIAEQILDNVSRAIQSRGWIFNTDLDVQMSVDQYGEIKLSPDILRVDTTSRVRNGDTDIVERGRKLYDRQKQTFIFTTKVTVNQIKLLVFEDLPEPARRYIAIRSARIFHDRVVGSGELHRFYQEDEMNSWQALLEYEGDVADYNIFDNYDVFRVVDRDVNSTYGLTRNLVDSSETN
tara:strand:+ start:279 stop:920 length:642 start_codon:yes stop_codon:yes gene_type:complete